MGKKLVITEKPSVAHDIAKALGQFADRKEYLEGEEYLITWALGHLVTLAEPEDYDKKLKSWRLSLLPIIPEEFKLKPIEGAEKRLAVIQELLASSDVESVVNACDAGREGELIFRYIYEFMGAKKPVWRLWLSSMTREAIRSAFAELKAASDYELLAQAAKCRSEGDWLVGINGTRAFTTRYKILLSVGRVQTPTLAILVHREREIQEFRPTKYFEVFAEFTSPQGKYVGKWHNGEDRFFEESQAQAVVDKVLGKKGEVSDFTEQSPNLILFSMTLPSSREMPIACWDTRRREPLILLRDSTSTTSSLPIPVPVPGTSLRTSYRRWRNPSKCSGGVVFMILQLW